MNSYYHATLDTHTDTKKFTKKECGKYEAFDTDGTPKLRFGNECAISDRKQLSASKSVSGSIFAILKKFVNITGDATGIGQPIKVSVYKIQREVDIDCSKSVYGDFGLIEEVRFESKSKFPIQSPKVNTYTIPPQAAADVELTYLPQVYNTSQIISDWGRCTKKAIQQFVNSNKYPTVEDTFDVEKPDTESYLNGQIRG